MWLLQFSDPHLLGDPDGLCRGRPPLHLLRSGLQQALAQAQRFGASPDLLLISGDLCHDESWLGYSLLRDLLADLDLSIALLPGNHDHPQRLRAALGRRWPVAPALLAWGSVDLVLLDSHRPGCDGGWLGEAQLAWLRGVLAARRRAPLLVALHHQPLAIGEAGLDSMCLAEGPELLQLLQGEPDLRAVLFGHIHQHWQGTLPGRPEVLLLGCPSSLCSFAAVQPCPLGRPADPGARLLEIGPGGGLQHRLLRWSASAPFSVDPSRDVPHTGS